MLQLACAAAQGFALLNGDSTISYLCKPLTSEEALATRFNDGRCDSAGRFFAGTICNQEEGVAGKLYRYDPATGTSVVVDEGPFTVRLPYAQHPTGTESFELVGF